MTVNDSTALSRRQMVGGAGVGLAASGPAAAQSAQVQRQQGQTGEKIRDPREKYPKPPFEKQSQPWPGLARNMNPPPDHGEETYRGSGRLLGRKALITGGDSGMGRAAAIAYAREGADVAINYFPSEEPDAQDVVKLIREAGRKAGGDPRRPARGGVLPAPGRSGRTTAWRARHCGLQRRAAADPRLNS